MDKLKNWQVPVFVTFLLLGLLITVQFRSQQNYLRDLPQQKEEDLILMLNKINDKKSELEKELGDLDRQLRLISSNVSEEETLTKQLRKDITKQKMAMGIVTVKGPGITITIDADLVYIDVIDIINELWNSQAEAIAINDRRITGWSKIYWSEQASALTVDGEVITYPCMIKAIGDPEKLDSGLHLLGGVLDNLAIYDIHPTIKKEDLIELPAADYPNTYYLKPKIEE
jgi:uncharacterized protein YlxW (UPF0749 family)